MKEKLLPMEDAPGKFKKLARWLSSAFLVLASVGVMYAGARKAPQPAPALNNPATLVSGSKIYAAQCEICHFSTSKAKKIGPGLANIYPGGKFANGKKVDDASMRVWIEMGGKDMPGFKESLKPAEIRDLIAYLRTL